MDLSLALLIDPEDGEALEDVSKSTQLDAEQRLLLAILENAIEDFQKHVLAKDNRGKALFDEVETWILATHSDAFFSFENVCEHIRLDPSYVRRGLMRWKKAKLIARRQQCQMIPNGFVIAA